MKVVCIDTQTGRSDGMGKSTDITEGKEYEVVAVLEDKYRIVNDRKRLSNHSKSRFEVVDDSTIEPLMRSFNRLTSDLLEETNNTKDKNEKLVEENEKLKKVVRTSMNYIMFTYGDAPLKDHPQRLLIEQMATLLKDKEVLEELNED